MILRVKPGASGVKISYFEQLNHSVFALLATRYFSLKIGHLVTRIGIPIGLAVLRSVTMNYIERINLQAKCMRSYGPSN